MARKQQYVAALGSKIIRSKWHRYWASRSSRKMGAIGGTSLGSIFIEIQ